MKRAGGLKTNLPYQAKDKAARTCFACKTTREKQLLLRLIVDEEGQIWPDFSAKLPGRGVYLCMEEDCLNKMSDKRLGVLRRDFSPQLPQWDVLQQRIFDMLSQRLNQLLNGGKRQAVIGRDAVMHQMWDKKTLLVLFAADAGDALLRQVNDGMDKRALGEMKSAAQDKTIVSLLDAEALGSALGREKIAVVAFTEKSPLLKLQQISVWQQRFGSMLAKQQGK